MENPIKMDDLGVRLFLETPIYTPTSIFATDDILWFVPHPSNSRQQDFLHSYLEESL